MVIIEAGQCLHTAYFILWTWDMLGYFQGGFGQDRETVNLQVRACGRLHFPKMTASHLSFHIPFCTVTLTPSPIPYICSLISGEVCDEYGRHGTLCLLRPSHERQCRFRLVTHFWSLESLSKRSDFLAKRKPKLLRRGHSCQLQLRSQLRSLNFLAHK